MQLKFFIIFSLIFSVESFFWNCFGFGSYGITYQLYTKQNPVYGQPLIYLNGNSVASSYLNNARPTRLIIHGFGQNGRSIFARDMKNSYLSRGDFNVIIVDWSSVSSIYYAYARYKVNPTGIAVSKFLDWLNVNYSTLHLIGYDLGAHISGIAGKYTRRGKIAKIVALDPSLPLFNENTSANRLSIGDANVVEVFHSNGDQLGFFKRLGDLDLYINNGKTQPECAGSADVNCAHYRAVIVFQRLLTKQNNYVIVPCENLEQVAEGCSMDPIEILLEEINPSGIYQITTVNAESVNAKEKVDKDVEIIS